MPNKGFPVTIFGLSSWPTRVPNSLNFAGSLRATCFELGTGKPAALATKSL